MTTPYKGRHGFTLIELLVVMAIMTALGLLALMLLPGINKSDAALKGTEEVRSACKVAQAYAAAARQPRGVRFLTNGSNFATEMQFLESPPVMVVDPLALVKNGSNTDGLSGPYVELIYDLDGTGAITTRHCYIRKLTAEQKGQVKAGGILVLPALGTWSRITTNINVTTEEVSLEVYPDSLMGASTAYRTYQAGVYGPPVPLLGQPTMPMPSNIAVDLSISSPKFSSTDIGPDYDVMFAPDGQVISVGMRSTSAGVYLWVRDVSKVPSLDLSGTALADAFRLSGEQHAVGISNGYVNTAPIQWPDASGAYPTGGAFQFVRKRLN